MAWTPISGSMLQYSTSANALASNYYLKFYQSGTTTAFNMATDSTGGTTLDKCQLDSSGYPTTDGTTRFIPHTNQKYKIALYKNSTDADNNTTGNADWVIDGIEQNPTEEKVFENVAAMVADSGLSVGDYVTTLGYTSAGDGGGNGYNIVAASTGTADGGSYINLATHQAQATFPNGIYIKQFGAKEDQSTDDSAVVQAAIDYCATFIDWPPIRVTGPTRLASSVNIDRTVDTETSEFRIIGEGSDAGFYASSSVTFFDTTLTITTDPRSEFVTFENLKFESASFFDNTYVVSEGFLRTKCVNCFFYLCRFCISTIYTQTMYFLHCNIRNNPANFVNSDGLYDVAFIGCVIENGQTIVRCVGTVRGCVGLRFIGCVIEGIGSSVVVATGVGGFAYHDNHSELNFSPELNMWGGSVANTSISIVGNFFNNSTGDIGYYGPGSNVFSSGNQVEGTGYLHSNIAQTEKLISCADDATNLSDATIYCTLNGVYRAGNGQDAWTHAQNHLNKDTTGNFGFGLAAQATNRAHFRGSDQTSSNNMAVFDDSSGNPLLALRNDRQALLYNLQDYANDSAAATGGIPINGLYRNGSVVQVRMT